MAFLEAFIPTDICSLEKGPWILFLHGPVAATWPHSTSAGFLTKAWFPSQTMCWQWRRGKSIISFASFNRPQIMFFFFKQVWLIFILNCLIISFKLLWSLFFEVELGLFSPFRVWQTITLCREWGINWIREAEQVALGDMISKSPLPCQCAFSTSLLLLFLCFCFCCGLVWGKKKKERKTQQLQMWMKCDFQNWCRCACVLCMWAFACGGCTRVSMCEDPQTRRSGRKQQQGSFTTSTASLWHKCQLWQAFNLRFSPCKYLCHDLPRHATKQEL